MLLKQLETLSYDWGEDVLFLTVSTDRDIRELERFVYDHDITLPVLLDYGTASAYGVRGVPVTFVIDEKGRINFKHKGFRPDFDEVLTVELNYLLKQ